MCPTLNSADATRLLVDLVRQTSVVGSAGEIAFADLLVERLGRLIPGFSIEALPAERDLKFVFGWRRGSTRDCVLLLGHYDTVGLSDYGPLKKVACRPRELRAAIAKSNLSAQARQHLADDCWMWGRGTLDMKAGIVLHCMTLASLPLERTPTILFAFTPDEEGDSKGVKAFIAHLRGFLGANGLRLRLVLNSDFTEERGAIFTGTIGKMLVNTLVRGIPTHVSTPDEGLSAALLASKIIPAIKSIDTPHPAPSCLLIRDLKAEYSVQTPDVIWSYFNFFYGLETPGKVLSQAERQVKSAVGKGIRVESIRSRSHPASPLAGQFGVYEPREDARRRILQRWREVGVALYFSPPFYPSFVTPLKNDKVVAAGVSNAVKAVEQRFKERFHIRPYYPYISDLSFFNAATSTWKEFQKYCPLPMEFPTPIQKEPFIVLDVGPYGRDAHQFTERVDTHYAFGVLPVFYESLLSTVSEGFT